MAHNANTRQIWISPYRRADGTLVEGHWRTVPDDTTDNNRRH